MTTEKDRDQAVVRVMRKAEERLVHFISKYGVRKTHRIIVEILAAVQDRQQVMDCRADAGVFSPLFEELYWNYVSSGGNPVLTFLEYKILAELVTELLYSGEEW